LKGKREFCSYGSLSIRANTLGNEGDIGVAFYCHPVRKQASASVTQCFPLAWMSRPTADAHVCLSLDANYEVLVCHIVSNQTTLIAAAEKEAGLPLVFNLAEHTAGAACMYAELLSGMSYAVFADNGE